MDLEINEFRDVRGTKTTNSIKINQRVIIFRNCQNLSNSHSKMTRYARSEGSKAANKREEEPATPWHVMVANIRRSGPPTDRRKEIVSKQRHSNPEDFDESDDLALVNQNYDHEASEKKEEEEEDEEQEASGMIFNLHISIIFTVLVTY